MERRVLLAIFLAFLVLYTWQALFVKPVPKPAAGVSRDDAPSRRRRPPAAAAGAGSRVAAVSAGGRREAGRAARARRSSATRAERDVRVETRDVIAVFTNRGARLKSWRLKHYLDQQRQPQELVEHLPSQPLPFTLRAGRRDDDATLNDALYTVSGAPTSASESSPVDLRFEYRDSAGAPRGQGIPPRSRVVHRQRSARRSPRATGRSPPAIVWGPAIGDIGESRAATSRRPEGILFRDGKVVRLAAEGHREAADLRRRLPVRRRRRQLLHDRGAVARPEQGHLQPVSIPPPAGSKDAGARSGRVLDRAAARRRAAEVLRRPEGLRRAQRDRSRPRAGDRLRHVRGDRRAAAALAEVGQRLRRQLRLVDHHPDDHHQRDHVPAAAQERRVDAEDAGDPAGGESDPGSLREAEGDRSGEAEDEPGADGALQGARRQPGERLRADAADDAGALRVLRAAVDGDRAARRAVLRLDSRSVGARSATTSRRS